MTFLHNRRWIASASLLSCAIFSFNMNTALAQGHHAQVRVDTVKLRSGPGESHKPKALLNGGRTARVLKRSGKWVNLRLESGTEGWVRSDLLAISKAKSEARHHKKSHNDSVSSDDRRSRRAREREAAREAEREEVRRQARRAEARAAAVAEIRAQKRAAAHAEAKMEAHARAKAAKLNALARAQAAAKMKQVAKAKAADEQQRQVEDTLQHRLIMARLSADAAAALRTVSAPKSAPVPPAEKRDQNTEEPVTPKTAPKPGDNENKTDTPPRAEATIDLPIVEESSTPVVAPDGSSATPISRSLVAALPRIERRVQAALTSRGTPYRFGATGNGAFDCSAFTRYIFSKSGVGLPRTAAEQFTRGVRVPKDQLQKGDLVFFKNTYRHGVSHVGMYLGNGKFIHASSGGHQVQINDLSAAYYVHHWAGARRPR